MKLFIDEYSKFHHGKSMIFAAQDEQYLEDHKADILADLNMLVQMQVSITLIHAIPPDNAKLEEYFMNSIPWIRIIRTQEDDDFCEKVFEYAKGNNKLIYLTREALVDWKGKKINAISTYKLHKKWSQIGEKEHEVSYCDILGITNHSVRDCLETICRKVHQWLLPRTHFVPLQDDHAIRDELFSIEGRGTIIEDDFSKPTIEPTTPDEITIIFEIFEAHKHDCYLKPRSKEYIRAHLSSFYTAHIDHIPTGCVEIKELDEDTYELAWLAVLETFLSLKIWAAMIQYVEEKAALDRKKLVCVTPNPLLQEKLLKNWYREDIDGKYTWRSSQSPHAVLYKKENS